MLAKGGAAGQREACRYWPSGERAGGSMGGCNFAPTRASGAPVRRHAAAGPALLAHPPALLHELLPTFAPSLLIRASSAIRPPYYRIRAPVATAQSCLSWPSPYCAPGAPTVARQRGQGRQGSRRGLKPPVWARRPPGARVRRPANAGTVLHSTMLARDCALHNLSPSLVHSRASPSHQAGLARQRGRPRSRSLQHSSAPPARSRRLSLKILRARTLPAGGAHRCSSFC